MTVRISKMSGKMEGFRGINMNPLSNPFCNKMSEKENTICSKCYSRRLLNTARRSALAPFEETSQLMSNHELTTDEIPRFYPGEFVRFLAHGELTNETCFKNFCKIADANPHAKFVMWTKRLDIVNEKTIRLAPNNLRLIYSSPTINPEVYRLPFGFDGVFNVFTEDFVKKNNIEINCPGKCIGCMRCYSGNAGVINEVVKLVNNPGKREKKYEG